LCKINQTNDQPVNIYFHLQ